MTVQVNHISLDVRVSVRAAAQRIELKAIATPVVQVCGKARMRLSWLSVFRFQLHATGL